mmetsp:Transcript_58963/g.126737  ORF Transcript_58963/g.126737 Transcript_58963/m.126737 type:complete len:103 (+) Transcript_58963:149-457(+)
MVAPCQTRRGACADACVYVDPHVLEHPGSGRPPRGCQAMMLLWKPLGVLVQTHEQEFSLRSCPRYHAAARPLQMAKVLLAMMSRDARCCSAKHLSATDPAVR